MPRSVAQKVAGLLDLRSLHALRVEVAWQRWERGRDFSLPSAMEIARWAGVHPGTVSRWMQGMRCSSPEAVEKIARRASVELGKHVDARSLAWEKLRRNW